MTDDRESLRALISSALEASIDCCARCKVCEQQVDAVMAAVEEARATTAEVMLAEVRSVLLEGGQDHATARRRAIAITGTGRDRADASEAKLAEVRSTVTAFLGHYGNSTAASFQQALDLAHGVLQVLDRAPLGAQELGGGEGAGQ